MVSVSTMILHDIYNIYIYDLMAATSCTGALLSLASFLEMCF